MCRGGFNRKTRSTSEFLAIELWELVVCWKVWNEVPYIFLADSGSFNVHPLRRSDFSASELIVQTFDALSVRRDYGHSRHDHAFIHVGFQKRRWIWKGE